MEVEAAVLRVVVAEEDQEEEGEGNSMTEILTEDILQELRELVKDFSDVICNEIGTARNAWHKIDVGNNQSILVPPHRLAAYWRDQL